ncbi:hypothetical protein ACN28E_42735 [Archangium lansingense]|uniref:hypothetical protein n=1 Tax=Archangium lansingense TaxID=2995310 RepID=UPI003B7A5425
MRDSDRIVVTNQELVDRIGDYIFAGGAFAFFHRKAFKKSSHPWTSQLFGPEEQGPRVLSLLGREVPALPGIKFRAVSPPQLSLAAVTSDKALYREGHDEVHLLALDPLAPGAEVVLELLVNGALFATHPARLDARGAAAVTLRELPVGDYTVRFQGAPDDAPACEFTVAQYRLAPLVARLVERKLELDTLTTKLFLESFGTPVTSRVRLELMDRGMRREEKIGVARDGFTEVSFELTGRGPHAINVQLLSDPSRTATVPIVGSREEERSRTVLSMLGEEIGASLLPGNSSRPVRGLWLEGGPMRSTPFHLERVEAKKARLEVKTAIDTALLVVIDAKGGLRELALGGLASGAIVEVDVPEPMGLLAIGAFVGGEPWEGWAAVLTPSSVEPVLTVPQRSVPGEEAQLEFDTGRAEDDASVYVVVKDARLLSTDTPASRLAAGLKAHAEGARGVLHFGKPDTRLTQLMPKPSPLDFEYERGIVYSDAPAGGAMLFEEDDAFDDLALRDPSASEPRAAQESTLTPRAVQEPEVLFAGLVTTRRGRASLTFHTAPEPADYLIEVFVIAGMDWAQTEARFRAEQEQYVSLELPAFVHREDAALARLHVGSRLPGVRVRVLRDGVEVPLIHEGRLLASGEELGEGRGELTFLAGPGHYEALMEDASGILARTAKQVEEPGKLRRLARTVCLLEPGKALSLEEDATIVSLRVLPGLKSPFRALVEATADYGHACCEQTAAKMLAACAMYAFSDERRAKAESIIHAGIARERSMFLPGLGFKMYPESVDEPIPYWGAKAAMYLHHLALLKDLRGTATIGPALAHAVEEGLTMARDATRAYGLTWPPTRLGSCEDAYLALRFGDGVDREQVLDVARRWNGSQEEDHRGAVAMRTEQAYAAAILLRAGGPAELPRAIALANQVVAQLGENGRLYSTVDSVAAIALLVELQAAQVVGADGIVELDGEHLPVAKAAASAREAHSVRALETRVAVEVTRLREEDWGTFHTKLPIAVSLHKQESVTRRVNAADALELRVRLESGYEPGDLVWVCLPDALSRVMGGGQVKQFSIDFQGENELRIPLAATGVTVGPKGELAPARFAVCVRNMFEEERGGSPGFIEVTVAPPTAGSMLGRALDALKHLFN